MTGTVHDESISREPRPSSVTPILIVEDDALVASYIRDVLEETGFIVLGIASTGAEAFALAQEMHPRLALVDIKLAGPIDGIDVARELLARFQISSIFLSGISDPAVLARATAIGAVGFLQKPFRPSQVFNALEKALGMSLRH
jgi:DNA-binding NarL/FixJ family response regulator